MATCNLGSRVPKRSDKRSITITFFFPDRTQYYNTILIIIILVSKVLLYNRLNNPIRAGFGGLLRHQTGRWITAFSGYIAGTSDILLVELYAIHRGLLLAREMNFQEVFCYTNSLHCVQILKELTLRFHKYATLIQDIKDLLNPDWLASIDHTLREGNSCADFLAKIGASSTRGVCCSHHPSDRII